MIYLFVLFCFVHVLVGCRQWCQALGLAQCEKGGFALAVTLGHFRIHKICLHWTRFDALTFLTPYIPAWLCIVALPAAKSCFCNNFLLQRQSSCQDPKYLLAIAGGVAAIGVIAELPCLQYRVGRHCTGLKHFISTICCHFSVEEIQHQLAQLTVYT